MIEPDVYNDSCGTIYLAGERRHHIFQWCAAMKKEKREIRWNPDLSCYVLKVKTDSDKRQLRQLLSQC